MPALADKIFLPIDIFIVTVVFAVFRFVLVSAVGACFAIYAKYGGEYAKSVGWIRSSGYRGMVKTFWNTHKRKNVPTSVKGALVIALLATLIASFLDKGIARYIHPTFNLGRPERTVLNSPQINPPDVGVFYGWNFAVPANGSAVHTMKEVLNSSLVIHELRAGHRYDPVVSPYNVTCADFGVVFQSNNIKSAGSGCGTVFLDFRYPVINPAVFNMTQRSSNRWSIIWGSGSEEEGKPEFMLDKPLTVAFRVNSSGEYTNIQFINCALQETIRPTYDDDHWFNYKGWFGISTSPGTSTTKCLFDTAESTDITAIALTTTRFINIDDPYPADEVRTMFVNKTDDLLLAMQEATKVEQVVHVPYGSPPNNTVDIDIDIWAELRVNNSSIDIYICGSSRVHHDHRKNECLYGTISVLQFTQPRHDAILNSRGGKDFVRDKLKGTYMRMDYLTNNYNGTLFPISVEKMRNDTDGVADYMAQLGYNYYAEFGRFGSQQGRVFIEYDISVLEFGFEVPLWVLVASGIILVISLVVWQLTDWLIGSPYTSSVYTIIRKGLASCTNTSIPRLMRFQFQPLAFEEVKILPEEIELLPD
ncbi:hypothetical protein BGX34_004787, partial [Mortierella sp. NVP85]